MTELDKILEANQSKIKEMIDADLIIGNPIEYVNKKVVPISKIKCAYLEGGINNNTVSNNVKIADGGTVEIKPVGFLVITEEEIKVLHLEESTHSLEYLLDAGLELVTQLLSKIKKQS